MLTVEPDVALGSAPQVFAGLEAIRRQHTSNPAIEAFDRAVGLLVTRLGQAAFDTWCRTEPIKLMLTADLLSPAKQAIGKLAVTINQQRAHLNGSTLLNAVRST